VPRVTHQARPPLVLASTSAYRRALLGRLGLQFECVSPATDETPLERETPVDLACRLARLKAESVAAVRPDAVVVGSDQVALLGEQVLGKPGTVERCIAQLRQSSGRDVLFLTAVHVIGPRGATAESHVDRTVVRFRALGDAELERYVSAENPLDCAGGFKAESLGISLFERIASDDPTGLTGLPLIWLCGALRRAGIPVP
jgi:7-methyl-GTP pyrophosphatase